MCQPLISPYTDQNVKVQYHQYAPIGPYNTNMLPYQRTVHDLFLASEAREELQKKLAASLQTLPNSQLPQHIESYHSLVPLDITHHKSSSIFGGYHSWIYKAQSSANGHFFVLRRIEGTITPNLIGQANHDRFSSDQRARYTFSPTLEAYF
jgi:hypothetical protein